MSQQTLQNSTIINVLPASNSIQVNYLMSDSTLGSFTLPADPPPTDIQITAQMTAILANRNAIIALAASLNTDLSGTLIEGTPS